VIYLTLRALPEGEREAAEFFDQFCEQCEQLNDNEQARAAIIVGEGSSCWDFDYSLVGSEDPEVLSNRFCGFHRVVDLVAGIGIPTIAAIRGKVSCQGLELAIACDLRVASEESCFQMRQLEFGNIPRFGGSQRLPRLIGYSRAIEMLLTADPVSAKQALQIGLINRCAPDDLGLSIAHEVGVHIAEKAPFALRFTKEAVYKGLDLTLNQGLELEADLYFLLQTTRDRENGMLAYKERRHPDYQGD